MSIKIPKERTVWKYIGGGGIKHFVLSSGPEEIITWSEPCAVPTQNRAGDSWIGPPDEFFKRFKTTAKLQ